MIELLLLGGVPLGVWAMERLRRRQMKRAHAEFLGRLDDDVQIALHVANHEARQRNQVLHPLHLAYGLLQAEPVQELIAKIGGSAEKIEEAVTAALDTPAFDASGREALQALAYAAGVAAHLDRRAAAADLWARVARDPLVAAAFDAGGLPAHRLLFALVHGGDPPQLALPAPAPGAVFVVLRNDDVTTIEFVRAMLREVFDLDAARAEAVTMETHTAGRAIVGRFSPDVAATRIESARSRARAAGFPLWVGVEPA